MAGEVQGGPWASGATNRTLPRRRLNTEQQRGDAIVSRVMFSPVIFLHPYLTDVPQQVNLSLARHFNGETGEEWRCCPGNRRLEKAAFAELGGGSGTSPEMRGACSDGLLNTGSGYAGEWLAPASTGPGMPIRLPCPPLASGVGAHSRGRYARGMTGLPVRAGSESTRSARGTNWRKSSGVGE